MAGTLTISTLSDGTNSTSTTNCIQGSAKAWASYNGSAQTINKSYNVSSITYNSTGNYTVNFTNAMATATYATTMGFYPPSSSGNYLSGYLDTQATTYVRIGCGAVGVSIVNSTNICIAVFA